MRYRILYLLLYGSRVGGGEIQYECLIQGLDRDRFQPIVVCPKAGDLTEAFEASGVKTHILRLPRWLQIQSFPFRSLATKKLVQLAQQYQVDLIHSEHRMVPYLKAVSRSLEIPSVFHVRARIRPKHFQRLFLKSASAAIVIGDRYRDSLIKAGFDSDQIHLIFDATDTDRFRPIPKPVNVLDRTTATIKIGLVGRIEPLKRQLDFLSAAKQIVQIRDSVAFFLIGEVRVQSYFRQLRRYISQNQLDSNVAFTGKRDDMPGVLASLDLLVTLSGGSVMIEALACGTPVVSASDADPTKLKIVKDQYNGLVVPAMDRQALTEAMLKLIDDPAYRQHLGRNARTHAENHFSQAVMIQKTEQVYHTLIRN